MLGVSVEPGLERIAAGAGGVVGLRARVLAGLARVGGGGQIVRFGLIVGFVVVIEGGNLKERGRAECVHPRENGVAVRLVLAVAEAGGVVELIFPVIRIGIVRDLVVVGAKLADEADLVVRITIINERG